MIDQQAPDPQTTDIDFGVVRDLSRKLADDVRAVGESETGRAEYRRTIDALTVQAAAAAKTEA